MPEFPSIPMRSNVSRSGQFIGKAGSGASYTAINFNLYWDNASMTPSEEIDFNIGIFEVDSSNNAVRVILNLSYTDVDDVTADELISQSSLNLNEDNTTDYIIRLSFESDSNMAYVSWSNHGSANDPGIVSEATDISAFGTSDANVVTDSDVGDLSGKTGYGSYTELGGTETSAKFRPGLVKPLWTFINVA